MNSRIDVAVGVIIDQQNDSVLIARRNDKQHLPGYWEFPGGKVDVGEAPRQALVRELYEELNIHSEFITPVFEIEHDYAEKKVRLHVYTVTGWQGNAVGREGQEVQWVPRNQLRNFQFPAANRNILLHLVLPELYLISRSHIEDMNVFISQLEGCVKNDLRLFQLRIEDDDPVNKEQIIEQIRAIDVNNQLMLILNDHPDNAMKYDVDGVHLKSNKLFEYSERPVSDRMLLGASCHNQEQIEQALLLDADYLFISPVLPTRSHPGAQTLAWSGFKKLSQHSHRPVYALGGMEPGMIETARQYGAHGIAMIEAVWSAAEPASMIRGITNV